MKYGKSEKYLEKEREAEQIRKDIATARYYIGDAILRYKKKRLRARSKQQAEDLSVFDELKDYTHKEQIRDAYGWDIISEAQMDRLMEMWDAREQLINTQGKFSDRVTEMLEHAMNCCADRFVEKLNEFEEMKQKREESIREIEKRNAEIAYERYIKGL